jgi:hypothetical protein
MNLHAILHSLAQRRPIFHSEFDFQHELAREIHNAIPGVQLRLERPVRIAQRRIELDIFAVDNNQRIAIELKYKTKRSCILHGAEQFDLAQHAATPLARYDAWRDVERLECLRLHNHANEAWMIFLTNDAGYWSPQPARGNGVAFSLHEGRQVGPNNLAWHNTSNTNSIGSGRVQPIAIGLQHQLGWMHYSTVQGANFRYLALRF